MFLYLLSIIGLMPVAPHPVPSRQIKGASLKAKVVGHAMAYVNASGKPDAVAVFTADGKYQFLGNEPWSTRAPYAVSDSHVCILTVPKRSCFEVFEGRNGTFIRRGEDGLVQRVRFDRLDPKVWR